MKRVLVAAALCLPILFLIAYSALLTPRIEFLRPSFSASWIVHPIPNTQGFFANVDRSAEAYFHSADVYFFRTFDLQAVPASYGVRVTALDTFTLTINEKTLTPVEKKNWKFGQKFELAPFLKRGENRLLIHVSYEKGVPALLVEAEGESDDALNSNANWRAGHTEHLVDSDPAAIAMKDEVFLKGKENWLKTSPYYWYFRFLLWLVSLFIIYSLVPVRFKPWIRQQEFHNAQCRSFVKQHGICIAAILLVSIAQFYSAAFRSTGYNMRDTHGHMSYIAYVAENWRVPLAEDGWQMYHPPAFYFLVAITRSVLSELSDCFSTFEFLRVFNTMLGIANIVFAWLLMQKLFPDRTLVRNLGVSLSAFLPIGFYMNSQVTNEVFAGSVIACTLYVSSLVLFDRVMNWKHAILLGSLCGLALLSKFTGLFVFVCILTLLALRLVAGDESSSRSSILKFGIQFSAVVVLIAAWFYIRNQLHYGKPFVGNWEPAVGSAFELSPGYRTTSFYTKFGAFLWHIPEWSRWSSFWDGMHGSLWTDSHHFFFNPLDNDKRINFLGSVILWLALLPSAGIIVGFLRACNFLLRRKWDHPLFILVVTSFWTLAASVLFTLELPFYTSTGAYFFLSLIPAIAVFAGLGLELLCQQLGRLRYVLYADLIVLYSLILYLFSFSPPTG